MEMKSAVTVFLLAAVLSAAFAIPSPAGMLDVSEGKEIRIGEDAAKMVMDYYGLVRNPAETERLKGVTDHLISVSGRPELEYHFYIIETDLVNAFALPGGYIFVTRGLMDFVDDDDELASVIAHELVHVAHRHGVIMYKKSIKDLVMNFLILALTRDPQALMAGQMYQQSRMDIFGRSAEVDADTTGLGYMAEAGYDPRASLRFMQNMKIENTHEPNLIEDYFEFHPPMEEREKLIRDEMKKLGVEAPAGRENRISERIIARQTCDADGECTVSLRGRKKDIMILGDAGNMGSIYDRARAIGTSLNDALDSGIRIFETEKRKTDDGWSIWARNTMIIKVLPGDMTANGAAGAEELADKWIENIKLFLWNDFVKDDI